MDIRRAWVGLVLPLSRGEVGPRQFLTHGVLTGPRTFLGYFFARLLRRLKVVNGFRVDAAEALEVLAQHDGRAAHWWRMHAPASVQRGRVFIFHAEVCQLVEMPPATAMAAAPDGANPGGPYTIDLN